MLRQSWRDRPRTAERRFGLSPQVAAQNKWARLEALQRNAWFVEAYHAARLAWRAGQRALFPAGTYYLRVHAGVPVADDPFAIPIRDPVVA